MLIRLLQFAASMPLRRISNCISQEDSSAYHFKRYIFFMQVTNDAYLLSLFQMKRFHIYELQSIRDTNDV